MDLLITQRNVVFFSDFQYGFRFSQSTAEIYWQLYLIKLPELLMGLGLLQL